MITPAILVAGLYFGANRTVLVLSSLAAVGSAALFILWLMESDYWRHAPPPTVCDRDACDNDGAIRSLLAAGAILLPVLVPSLLSGLIAFLIALRRVAWRKQAPV
jgi:hypothetical protein